MGSATGIELREGVETLLCGCEVGIKSGGIHVPCEDIASSYGEAAGIIRRLFDTSSADRDNLEQITRQMKRHVTQQRAAKTKRQKAEGRRASG